MRGCNPSSDDGQPLTGVMQFGLIILYTMGIFSEVIYFSNVSLVPVVPGRSPAMFLLLLFSVQEIYTLP
jgi:hypothetical protein